MSLPWPFGARDTAPCDEEFNRIIVIVTRQIGDVLVTTPLIHAARQRWPHARIDVLGFAGTLGMLRGNRDVNDLLEVLPGSTWTASLPLIVKLWRRYDLALVAQYSDRAHLYGWMAASVRSGQVPAGPRSWWKRLMLRHSVELGDFHSHVVIEKLKLLAPWVKALDVQSVRPPPIAELPTDLAEELTAARYVVLQVPSLVHFKQWPLQHYVSVAKELASWGWLAVLTGGPSEADRTMVNRVAQACPQAVNACGRLDFNQLARLLRDAAAYVGPDTSVTHLAAACGTPTVALFGPTDPKLWGPWPNCWAASQPYESSGFAQRRGDIVLLQGGQRCVPCSSAGCDRRPDSRSECLETLWPERVLKELRVVLARTVTSVRR